MLPRGTLRFAWGAALAASLACHAAEQASDFAERLHSGQELRDHDRFAEARTVFQNLLRDVRNDGSDRRLEGLVGDNLALDEQDQGDYPAAETAFNHGLAAVSDEPAGDSVRVALRTHLAELYIAEIRPEDAEAILRQSLTALRASRRHDPMALSVLNEDLAVALIMRQRYAEPEALLREAQGLIETAYGPNDPRLASSLLTYSGLLTAQHRYRESVAPAERAWQILNNATLPIPKPYMASALSVLGAVYYHAGRMKEAVNCARQSVEIAEAALNPQHPRLGLYLANYATILKLAGRKNEAKAAQKKADQIMEQYPSFGNGGGYTVNVAALR